MINAIAIKQKLNAEIDRQGLPPERERMARSLVNVFVRLIIEMLEDERRKVKRELND